MERSKLKLLKNKRIGNFKLLSFEGNLKKNPLPGNFYMLVDTEDKFYLPRPYSVFHFENNVISFLVKDVGRFSEYLFNMKKDEEIYLLGPYGNNIQIKEKPIFIAGGIGFAPLFFHSSFLNDFIFFFGGMTKKDIICYKFINKEKIFVSTDDGSFGFKGDIVSIFLEKTKEIDLNGREIFACGPKSMLKKLKSCQNEINIPIYFYLEERMGCGFGGCKGCAILTKNGYKLVCKDGPVFRSEEVIFG